MNGNGFSGLIYHKVNVNLRRKLFTPDIILKLMYEIMYTAESFAIGAILTQSWDSVYAYATPHNVHT